MLGLMTLAIVLVVTSAVGLRLLWTAVHAGGGPTWACGLGFTTIGLLGYPLSTLSGYGVLTVGEMNHGVAAAGSVFTAAGVSCFWVFTLLTFRPHAVWAWALTALATVLLAVVTFGQIGALALADREMQAVAVAGGWMRGFLLISTACYAWTGFESLTEWVRARRRVALGITDPLVANRILLWGIHGVAITSLNGLLVVLDYHSVNLSQSVLVQLAMVSMALVSCTSISLAFFPTRAWASWVRARAEV